MTLNTPTRRKLLAAGVTAGLGAVAGCSQPGSTADPPEETALETVVSVPGERVPENMAFDSDGNFYFGITAGEIRRLSSDQLGETELTLADTDQIATLPDAIGVETAPDGTVYVAVTDGNDPGVWEVPSEGEAASLASIDGFPNDMLFEADRDRMLVTESFGGAVYTVGTDGSQSTWLEDDRLATEGFGANGITRGPDGDIYVAVTQAPEDTGRLLRVPVDENGSAGDPTLFVEDSQIYGADGITAHEGSLYVAANTSNRIVEVSLEGGLSTIATESDGLVSPSDVVFGPDGSLYICNFASGSPEDGAILRIAI